MITTEELIRSYQQGNKDSLNQLIEENTGLVWAVVKRFIGYGVETDDLFQIGCMGLIKAVMGFDEDYGTKFSTYAVPKITGEIRRFLRDDGTVKVSRSIKERANLIKVYRNQYILREGMEPTVSQISEATGLTTEEIALADSATAAVESINKVTGDDGFCLENMLTDTESEESLLERLSLRQAIAGLPEKECLVIKLRYYHGLTQDRVSKVLHVSQVQVSRIEKKALNRLKEMMGT